eukprot:NODE_3_length_80033_cov_0.932970.p52 type:complete len:169 gc:universal NODE_3_length_80033_cov_0.932970:28745-29251(+)
MECGRSTKIKFDLKVNILRPFCMDLKCKWAGCSTISESVPELYKHARTHIGYKKKGNFSTRCLWGDCTFERTTRSRLQEHIIKHFEYQPFNCKECESKFKNSRHLKKHMREKHMNYFSSSSPFFVADNILSVNSTYNQFLYFTSARDEKAFDEDVHPFDDDLLNFSFK